MEIINPRLNDEIHNMIMDSAGDAEVYRVLNPGDVGVLQRNPNGRTVGFHHEDPNRDIEVAHAGLSIFTRSKEGRRTPGHHWSVTRWSAEESFTGEPIVETEYRAPAHKRSIDKRISTNPDRTYKALARLASIHLNANSTAAKEQ